MTGRADRSPEHGCPRSRRVRMRRVVRTGPLKHLGSARLQETRKGRKKLRILESAEPPRLPGTSVVRHNTPTRPIHGDQPTVWKHPLGVSVPQVYSEDKHGFRGVASERP